jgi:hypothetical protein
LLHPGTVGVVGDAGQVNAPGLQIDGEENRVARQAVHCQDLDSEEIHCCSRAPVGLQEGGPRGSLAPLRGRLGWPPPRPPAVASVVLPGYEIPVPAQQGIRRDDACHARQRLPPHGLRADREPPPLSIGQSPAPPTELLAQNLVLLDQVRDRLLLAAIDPPSYREDAAPQDEVVHGWPGSAAPLKPGSQPIPPRNAGDLNRPSIGTAQAPGLSQFSPASSCGLSFRPICAWARILGGRQIRRSLALRGRFRVQP